MNGKIRNFTLNYLEESATLPLVGNVHCLGQPVEFAAQPCCFNFQVV